MEIGISGEGLNMAGTELAECGKSLRQISVELAAIMRESGECRDEMLISEKAQKTLGLRANTLDTMAEVLFRIAEEADSAEKMILDHEALIKVKAEAPETHDLAGMAEALRKAVKL